MIGQLCQDWQLLWFLWISFCLISFNHCDAAVATIKNFRRFFAFVFWHFHTSKKRKLIFASCSADFGISRSKFPKVSKLSSKSLLRRLRHPQSEICDFYTTFQQILADFPCWRTSKKKCMCGGARVFRHNELNFIKHFKKYQNFPQIKFETSPTPLGPQKVHSVILHGFWNILADFDHFWTYKWGKCLCITRVR